MPDLRYPVGPFVPGPAPDFRKRLGLLSQMAEAPDHLRAAVAGLLPEQLDTPYRPGGWTVRQVVHHLADAQMNWYLRTKLALTEDGPVVKPYDEARWAELYDARTAPVEPSLILLACITAGLSCFIPLRKRNGSGNWFIRSLVSSPWTPPWRCMSGTGGIIPRRLSYFGLEWAGLMLMMLELRHHEHPNDGDSG